MLAVIPVIYRGRKDLAELATQIEEGLICSNVIFWAGRKAALAFTVQELTNEEGAEATELEEIEGVQLFIGNTDTFNARMLNLAEQCYYVTLLAVDISKKKGHLVTATYTADFRKDGLPEECTCNGNKKEPCKACETCPVCGGNHENLCEECIAARAGMTLEQLKQAAAEQPGGASDPIVAEAGTAAVPTSEDNADEEAAPAEEAVEATTEEAPAEGAAEEAPEE
jgi:hypothetical protein